MKKFIMAIAGVLAFSQAGLAQEFEATSISYEESAVEAYEDASQGLLINQFKANWFITAQGGASVLFSSYDQHRDFEYRIQPAAALYVGKWFTPVVGLRLGADWFMNKGYSISPNTLGVTNLNPENGGYYTMKYMHVGPAFDAMVNLTNWWCGYNPNRVYNLTAYAGGAMYFTLARDLENGHRTGYKDAVDKVLSLRFGLINTFHVSNRWDIFLDLRAVACDGHNDKNYVGWNRMEFDAQAYLGVTYNFGKTTWNGPMIPVCPPAENCDGYRAALAAAEAQIADLQAQLNDCLNRPTEVVEVAECNAPLCTIYFPCNVSKLTKEDVKVLNAVAEIIKDNSGTNYVVTGWADNYTGNDKINTNLRENRAKNVADQLIKAGVNKSQVTTTINDGNLYGNDKKFMVLDRAATVQVAQ